ncbi:DUF6270 domain-containing protein [Brachybacterium paraconglomeratum]|uniref:DUF6270 domain-containing protein n=1 Tax=Brachybacterium paraconglomeratum TaxID=173362 RepID=UPI0037C7F16D
MVRDDSSSATRALVVGSCVTRDLFELEQPFELTGYVARSSLSTMFAGPVKFDLPHFAPERNGSQFQRRMAITEIEKLAALRIASDSWDILVLDLVDERLPVVRLGSSIATIGPELSSCLPFETHPEDHLPKSSRSRYWRSGVRQLMRLANGRPIIVNRVRWATHDDDGDPVCSVETAEAMNRDLEQMEAALTGYPNIYLMASAREWKSSKRHRWGVAPFHYSLDVQTEQLDDLLQVAEKAIAEGVAHTSPSQPSEERFGADQRGAYSAFVGHTRFSILSPGSGAWNLSQELDEATYKSELFSTDRLRFRLDLLMGSLTPQLERARQGHDFVHVLSVSDEIPDWCMAEINEIAEEFDWLKVHSVARGEGLPEVSDAIEFALGVCDTLQRGQRIIGFRIDDDDTIADWFFDELLELATRINVGDRAGTRYGITVSTGGGGASVTRDETRESSVGLAGAYLAPEHGGVQGPSQVSHNRSSEFNVFVSSPRSGSYIRGVHGGQDSRSQSAASPLGSLRRPTNATDLRDLIANFSGVWENGGSGGAFGVVASAGSCVSTGALKASVLRVLPLLLVAGVRQPRSLVLTVRLVDRHGVTLDPSSLDPDITIGNLNHSTLPGVGLYRYVNISTGYGIQSPEVWFDCGSDYLISEVALVDLAGGHMSVENLGLAALTVRGHEK